jgi:hypothetical protein
VDLKVFRRAADAMAAESQQNKVDDTKSMTYLTRQAIFGYSAAHGGSANVPPQVHIPATAASHPILAEANEKNASQRNPAGRAAGGNGRRTEAL